MEVHEELITKEMAQDYLQKNIGNRPIREALVCRFVRAIKNGEWNLTHQGIAFDIDGHLADGQHRLVAICRSGIPTRMLVTRGLMPKAYSCIDTGTKKRIGESLRIEPHVAETLTFIASIVGDKISAAEVKHFLDTPFHIAAKVIFDANSGCRKIASCSAVKAAATIVAVENSNYSGIAAQYANFVSCNYDNMTPSLLAFERQIAHGKLNGYHKIDTFCRGLAAFTTPSLSEIRIYDRSSEIAVGRVIMLVKKLVVGIDLQVPEMTQYVKDRVRSLSKKSGK